MNQSEPLVSVTVITYNSGLYVIETLESIRNQTYKNIELIISDDSSKDDTVNLCDQWLQKNGKRFIHAELIRSTINTGITSNKNRAIAKCSGEWLKSIAGDDYLEPETIATYISYIDMNPNVKCLFSNLKEYKNNFSEKNLILPILDASKFEICRPYINADEQYQILLRSNKLWAITFFININTLHEIGGYNENYSFFEDRPIYLRLTKLGFKIHYIDIFGAKYRKHDGSVQNNASKLFRTNYFISKQKYFIDNHLDEFRFTERTLMKCRYIKDMMFIKISNNRSNLVLRIMDSFIERVLFYPIKILI